MDLSRTLTNALPGGPVRLCLMGLALGCALSACTRGDTPGGPSLAERQADLAFLAEEFAEREQSFTPQTRALFDARIAEIDGRLESLSDDEFLAAVQWAVAAADNGHTETLTHEKQRLRLPLDLHWFADGLFVVAVRPGNEASLGARVLAIDGKTPDDLLAALDPYSPGTDEHARVLSGYFLERPQLLAAIGSAAEADALTLTLELPGGEVVTQRFQARVGESTAKAADALPLLGPDTPLPLYLREPDEAAFVAWLPESDAVYIRINRNDDEALPRRLEAIAREVERRAPRNVIVDLRLNGGGNYELTAPFAEAMAGRVPPDGKLFLILGNRTFSAGLINAAILKAGAGGNAVIVGERVGDDLTFWSEGGFLALPNSGLRIHYSDGYHDWRDGFDAADPRYRSNPRIATVNERYSAAAASLEPDIPVGLTFTDYAAGRDPGMAAVRSALAASQ